MKQRLDVLHQSDQIPFPGSKVNISHVGVTSPHGDLQELFDSIKICVASRMFPPELSPLFQNASILSSSVNIATDDTDGDGTKRWRDPSVVDIVSEHNRSIKTIATANKKSILTKGILAKRWGCGLESARKTLLVTTQHGIRHVIQPYDRRYRTTFDHLTSIIAIQCFVRLSLYVTKYVARYIPMVKPIHIVTLTIERTKLVDPLWISSTTLAWYQTISLQTIPKN